MSGIALKYLENARAQIKAEEERLVAVAKDNVVRNIQPKYQEIEQMKAEAINTLVTDFNTDKNILTEEYNKKMISLQNKFESDKKAVVENAEKKKTEILNSVLATETYAITKECDKAIAKLDAQIAELKE
jgi:F0F1-type ATP synthase membrane subunit b/b'